MFTEFVMLIKNKFQEWHLHIISATTDGSFWNQYWQCYSPEKLSPVFFEELLNAVDQSLWIKVNPQSPRPYLSSVFLCFVNLINLFHGKEVGFCSHESGKICKRIVEKLFCSLKEFLFCFQLIEIFGVFLYTTLLYKS